MTRILFACNRNACRSQMAEAFCRELGRNAECASAGSEPAEHVDPDAVVVMDETGIDISDCRPKGFDRHRDREFDYLVTMGCRETCPYWPGATELHWDIPDT